MLFILIISVGYQAHRTFRYTRLSSKQVKSAARDGNGVVIRIITANVLLHNRKAEKYLLVLAETNPDIILTTEADQWWSDKLKELDTSCPLENTYGMIRIKWWRRATVYSYRKIALEQLVSDAPMGKTAI